MMTTSTAMQYLEQSQQAKEKVMKRRRHRRLWLGLAVIMLALIPILYDGYQNMRYNHFYLSAKQGPFRNMLNSIEATQTR